MNGKKSRTKPQMLQIFTGKSKKEKKRITSKIRYRLKERKP
jgi:hypothetical protein